MGADYRKAHHTNGGGAAANLVTGATVYLPIFGGPANHAAEVRAEQYFSVACTLRNLRVHSHNPPGAGESYIFTVRVNGGATLLTATIAGAVDTEGTDLVNGIAIAPGDYVTMQIISSVAAVASYTTWGFEQGT